MAAKRGVGLQINAAHKKAEKLVAPLVRQAGKMSPAEQVALVDRLMRAIGEITELSRRHTARLVEQEILEARMNSRPNSRPSKAARAKGNARKR